MGAACGLAFQVRTSALRGDGRLKAASEGSQRRPRHLHCVMGRCASSDAIGARVGRPGRRGLGPAGLPRPRAARSRRGRLRRWRRGSGPLALPVIGADAPGVGPVSGAGAPAGGACAAAGRAGGRGGGGGPRRSALPVAAILSSEEEEEAAAAGPAARPARVSPGPARCPRRRRPRSGLSLSPTAHVGRVRRALCPPRRLGPYAWAGATRPRPHFLTFPSVLGALRRTRLFPPRRRLPLHSAWGASLALLTQLLSAWQPLAGRFVLLGRCSLGVLATAPFICGVTRGDGLELGCDGVVIRRNKMTSPPRWK